MNFDITHLLDGWDYKPGQVVVRKFVGKDGLEKIQLRVDLGILQMNMEGRPDGKRPMGHASVYDFYQSKLMDVIQAGEGEEKFRLTAEDCAKLQLEAIQYHHRYICLLQMQDYEGVVRDTSRNLEVFEFVGKFAQTQELAWSLQQFQPQLLLLQARAKGTQLIDGADFPAAIEAIREGVTLLQAFYEQHQRLDLLEQSAEIQSLEGWANEVEGQQPLSERQKLEQALEEAVQREDYESAAQYRDALKQINQTNP